MPGRAGWLHPYIHPCCGLCPMLTVCARLCFIYFTKQAKDSIKLFRQFDYLRCQCGCRGGLAVSRPLISRSWQGGRRPTSHTASCANPAPCALHLDDSSLLPLDETHGNIYQGHTDTLPHSSPHDFCCSIAANCSCQRGSMLIRGLHP